MNWLNKIDDVLDSVGGSRNKKEEGAVLVEEEPDLLNTTVALETPPRTVPGRVRRTPSSKKRPALREPIHLTSSDSNGGETMTSSLLQSTPTPDKEPATVNQQEFPAEPEPRIMQPVIDVAEEETHTEIPEMIPRPQTPPRDKTTIETTGVSQGEHLDESMVNRELPLLQSDLGSESAQTASPKVVATPFSTETNDPNHVEGESVQESPEVPSMEAMSTQSKAEPSTPLSTSRLLSAKPPSSGQSLPGSVRRIVPRRDSTSSEESVEQVNGPESNLVVQPSESGDATVRIRNASPRRPPPIELFQSIDATVGNVQMPTTNGVDVGLQSSMGDRNQVDDPPENDEGSRKPSGPETPLSNGYSGWGLNVTTMDPPDVDLRQQEDHVDGDETEQPETPNEQRRSPWRLFRRRRNTSDSIPHQEGVTEAVEKESTTNQLERSVETSPIVVPAAPKSVERALSPAIETPTPFNDWIADDALPPYQSIMNRQGTVHLWVVEAQRLPCPVGSLVQAVASLKPWKGRVRTARARASLHDGKTLVTWDESSRVRMSHAYTSDASPVPTISVELVYSPFNVVEFTMCSVELSCEPLLQLPGVKRKQWFTTVANGVAMASNEAPILHIEAMFAPGVTPDPPLRVPSVVEENEPSLRDDDNGSIDAHSRGSDLLMDDVTDTRKDKKHFLRLKKYFGPARCLVCQRNLSSAFRRVEAFQCEECGCDCCGDCRLRVDIELPCGSEKLVGVLHSSIQFKLRQWPTRVWLKSRRGKAFS